jgi:hypothetical protein
MFALILSHHVFSIVIINIAVFVQMKLALSENWKKVLIWSVL